MKELRSAHSSVKREKKSLFFVIFVALIMVTPAIPLMVLCGDDNENGNMSLGADPVGGTMVAAGGSYSLVLKDDGTVWACGKNDDGQLGNGARTDSSTLVQVMIDPATTLNGVIAIAAGYGHSLALTDGGEVWAWGNNSEGQLGNGVSGSGAVSSRPVQVMINGTDTLSDVIEIAAGSFHSMALKADGTVWTWGSNDFGQLGDGTETKSSGPVQVMIDPATTLSGVTAIAAGGYYCMALIDDEVWTWGNNYYGQLGDGNVGMGKERSTPVHVKEENGTGYLTGVTAIAAGYGHSMALIGGEVWTWGWNCCGQLGYGTDDGSTPARVVIDREPLSGVIAIAGGEYHSMALKSDGTVWTWGDGTYGQLGDGNTGPDTDRTAPMRVMINDTEPLSGVMAIAAGYGHSMALIDNEVWVWGSNYNGQLGDGAVLISYTPIRVIGLTGVTEIAAGYCHSMALIGGEVWTWGANDVGQLGDGTCGDGTDSSTPVHVKGENGTGYLTGVTAIAAGHDHSLALKEDGTVWAWGQNNVGQLGNGMRIDSSTPVQVMIDPATTLSGVIAIAAGDYHSLALTDLGTVWAWGLNRDGELGDGTATNSTTAVRVMTDATTTLSDVKAIAAGEFHSVALKEDGTVWGWGDNNFHQLGDATVPMSNTPIQVTGLTDVTEIATGTSHSLALIGGEVWGWGRNSYGQLGDGTRTDSGTPVRVISTGGAALTDVTEIAGGGGHSVALKDGTVWAWGSNSFGQLGDGTATNRTTAVQAGTTGDIAAVAAGYYHSMALTKDDHVLSWGYNNYGQLGDGSVLYTGIPLLIGANVVHTVTVVNGTGSGNYEAGENVTVAADTPPEGKGFDKWTTNDGITFTDENAAITTFTMPSKAVTVTATYKDLPPITYRIDIQNDGNGTANANVTSAAAGTEISLTAVPDVGYKFKEWQTVSGSITITANKFTMPPNDVTVKAVFEEITYSVTVTNGTGGGDYAAGSTVSITADAAPAGQRFDKWTVTGITLTDPGIASITFTMPPNDVTAAAAYAALTPDEHSVTVQNDGNGTANANVTSATAGTEISLTAVPDVGYKFKEWQTVSGSVTFTDVNSSSTTFVMPSDNVTVKAIFERTPEVRTDDGVSDKGTNITVIAAVAAAAVLFIGAAVYFMFLKKP